jgi:hypothetical protein
LTNFTESNLIIGYSQDEFEKGHVGKMTARLDFHEKKDRLIINEILKPWQPTKEDNM